MKHLDELELEEAAIAVSRRPLGSCWFRPDKVKAVSPFARQLQSTYSDLSRVDLDLPVGLLVGLAFAATCPDSPLDFRQAQSAAERSGVASPHCWSLMLRTSARVAQEVYEPLIGIQYSMLCSRLGDTWQKGTTSIQEDHLIAFGLRFVQWRHASPKEEPKNNPTVKVYQLLEDELARARAGTEGILALTTTREAAQNLRNYFEIAWNLHVSSSPSFLSLARTIVRTLVCTHTRMRTLLTTRFRWPRFVTGCPSSLGFSSSATTYTFVCLVLFIFICPFCVRMCLASFPGRMEATHASLWGGHFSKARTLSLACGAN